MPITNAAGLSLIETFEGEVLFSYDDAVWPPAPFKHGMTLRGTLTNGYGHTGPDVHPDQTITHELAVTQLQRDVREAETEVIRVVHVTLTPNEFAALVSFEYNTGMLASSPAIGLINQNRGTEAWEDHLVLYVHDSTGAVSAGLVRRRAAEYALWQTR